MGRQSRAGSWCGEGERELGRQQGACSCVGRDSGSWRLTKEPCFAGRDDRRTSDSASTSGRSAVSDAEAKRWVQAPAKVISKLLKSQPDMWQAVQEDMGHHEAKEVEEKMMGAIRQHWEDVALKIYLHLDLTERSYQKLTHLLSKQWNEEEEKRESVQSQYGTSMPNLPSRDWLLRKLKAIAGDLGMECADLRTNLDPAAVIRERASQLFKHGFLQPGQEITVQVLADATGLWKKGQVNATALVLKIIYDDTAGTRLAGHTVNSVANNKLLCLYVGDDCYSNMKEYAGDIPEKLRLIAEEGVTVDGVHSTVKFLGGGDSKLLCSWLGLAGGASNFGCFTCETHAELWHLSFAELKEKLRGADDADNPDPIPYRDTDRQADMSHVPRAVTFTCPCCNKDIHPNEQPTQFRDSRQRQAWQQLHLGTMHFCNPFFGWLPADRFVMDILHLVLRVVPVLFKHTVSSQLDPEQLEDVCRMFSDRTGVHISCGGAGQSAKGTKEERNPTECWSGEVCYTLMDDIMRVMEDAYLDQLQADEDPLKLQRYHASVEVWRAFICILAAIHEGCDDTDQASIEAHADEVEGLAEVFRQRYLQIASTRQVTVYMHHLWHHAATHIRRWGSLNKLSSQGTEAVHQVVKFVGRHRSDHKKSNVTRTCMTRVAAKQQVMDDPVVAQKLPKRSWNNMSEKVFLKHNALKQECGAKHVDVSNLKRKRV